MLFRSICSSNVLGKPSGIFLSPSRSSEYAMSSDLKPRFSNASLTQNALTASPRLPIWGIPEAPRPDSTLSNFVSRPICFSLSIISDASLSIHVPLPMIIFSSSDKLLNLIFLPYMDHLNYIQSFYSILEFQQQKLPKVFLHQILL